MRRAFPLVFAALLGACSDDSSPTKPSGGTETNVMGVPCEDDSECGEELECLPAPDGGSFTGKLCQKP